MDEVLRMFQEDALPPSRVDVQRAVRDGRRHRRIHVTAVATAVLLVVGAVTVPTWPGRGPADTFQAGQSAEPTRPPEPPPCVSPGPTPPAGSSKVDGSPPNEFDILRYWVTMDGLTDLHVEEYATARYWQRLTLVDAAGRTQVEVIVFARGGKPRFSDPPGSAPEAVDLSESVAAGPVAGKPAIWLPGRQGLHQYDTGRLGWQWGDGAWAFVAVADTAQQPGTLPSSAAMTQLQNKARQVAAAMKIGTDRPVVTPFTVGVPGCSRLTGTSMLRLAASDDKAFTRITLTFGRLDNTDPLLSGPDVATIVCADSAASPGDKPGSVNETVDGHPAVVGEGSLVLHGVDGFALEVYAPIGRDALLAYGRTIHVIAGAHDDESKWTDQPLQVR